MSLRQHDVIKVRLSDLKLDPKNPNTFTAEQHKALKKSYQKFGALKFLVIDQDNMIIDGHQRIQELKELGVQEVDAIRVQIKDESERILIRQTLNKLYGQHDKKLDSDDYLALFEKGLLGELAELLAKPQEEFQRALEKQHGIEFVKEDDFDVDAELDKPAITKLGDIWQLGRHMLMCGDSTKIEDVDRCLNSTPVAITFTSPPYNIGKPIDNTGTDSKYELEDQSPDWLDLLIKFTGVAITKSNYVFINLQQTANNKRDVVRYWHHFLDNYVDCLVWVKPSLPLLAKKVLNSDFEYVLIFSDQNKSRRIDSGSDWRGNISNVYQGSRNSSNAFSDTHRAGFPLHFPVFIITNFTKINDVIYEPFAGTGTTIIAAENLGRICYAIEIYPQYCDLIVKRWEQLTGKTAILLSSKNDSDSIIESVENGAK